MPIAVIAPGLGRKGKLILHEYIEQSESGTPSDLCDFVGHKKAGAGYKSLQIAIISRYSFIAIRASLSWRHYQACLDKTLTTLIKVSGGLRLMVFGGAV